MLKELESRLKSAGIPNLILSESRDHIEPDRIDKLSFARNKALEPLKGLGWSKDGWVMFLNDVSFRAADMLQLLDTQVRRVNNGVCLSLCLCFNINVYSRDHTPRCKHVLFCL
jgi:hypothetical protein